MSQIGYPKKWMFNTKNGLTCVVRVIYQCLTYPHLASTVFGYLWGTQFGATNT